MHSSLEQSAAIESDSVSCRGFMNSECCSWNCLHSLAAYAPFTIAEATINIAMADQTYQWVLCYTGAAS